MFWKKVKPFFSDNSVNFSKKALVEKNSIVVDGNKIANIMNNYFINITKTLTQHLINAKLIQKSLRTILASKKKYAKHHQKIFQEVFILNKYPVIS